MKKQLAKSNTTVDTLSTLAFIVHLESVDNPYYGKLPPQRDMPCITLGDCQRSVAAYISLFDLGGSNWAGGQVYHPTKGMVAQISYNGRIWRSTKKGERFTDDLKEIHASPNLCVEELDELGIFD